MAAAGLPWSLASKKLGADSWPFHLTTTRNTDFAIAIRPHKQVALLLGLPKAPNDDGLQFDLSFYSGGIGVYDQHAIAMNADAGLWSATKKHLSAKTPTESASDDAWSEEFNWLIYGDDEFPSLNDAVVAFVNRERKDFQEECTPNMTVLFQACSNVNDWSALWGTDTRLNYLGFSQG